MNLFWFRNDLRLYDNTALYHAAQQGSTIALFIITTKQWQQHDDAACKVDLWLRQLQHLSTQLAALNIPLLIRYCDWWQDIPALLLELSAQYPFKRVYCNQQYGVNERKRDSAVEQQLLDRQITFHSYHDQLIFPVGSIKNKTGEYYKVFGAFKQQCYERLYQHNHYFQTLAKPEKQKPIPIQSDMVPQTVLGFPCIDPTRQALWAVGEEQAWLQLDSFIDQHINQYHIERDFPALNTTSKVSTYLNAGLLSIRQCLQAARINTTGDILSGNDGVKIWLDELLWREFYTHTLYGFPQVSRHQPFKAETKHIRWLNTPENLSAWQQGKTGFPIIDAAMRQLLATGWMHNRLRMIVAMFLSKNLLINWRLGEQWFMQHLIDGELAANNGGWQWSASTGTDSVPYFRIFNPISQSQKFDPQGHFIRSWLPELAHLDNKAIHEPYRYIVDGETLNYPQPIVDLKQSRLRAIAAFQAVVKG